MGLSSIVGDAQGVSGARTTTLSATFGSIWLEDFAEALFHGLAREDVQERVPEGVASAHPAHGEVDRVGNGVRRDASVKHGQEIGEPAIEKRHAHDDQSSQRLVAVLLHVFVESCVFLHALRVLVRDSPDVVVAVEDSEQIGHENTRAVDSVPPVIAPCNATPVNVGSVSERAESEYRGRNSGE